MTHKLPWLNLDSLEFPDPTTAFTRPNGLLAAGGDLTPARLLRAYQCGIFPWFTEGEPLLWWSPNPRLVLLPTELHTSRSLFKALKLQPFRFSTDQAFAQVLTACAAPRDNNSGSWLLGSMQKAYQQLHSLGHAHSIEVWLGDELVGGLYGIALPGIFFGESMFSKVTNGSKAALVYLCTLLSKYHYTVIDCQITTEHLLSMGAKEITRDEFMSYLPKQTISICSPSAWPYNAQRP